MKLTPEELREIAERESLNTNEIREAFISQSRGNPEDEEECAEEIVIYDLCKALDQNSTDIPRLLAHIEAMKQDAIQVEELRLKVWDEALSLTVKIEHAHGYEKTKLRRRYFAIKEMWELLGGDRPQKAGEQA